MLSVTAENLRKVISSDIPTFLFFSLLLFLTLALCPASPYRFELVRKKSPTQLLPFHPKPYLVYSPDQHERMKCFHFILVVSTFLSSNPLNAGGFPYPHFQGGLKFHMAWFNFTSEANLLGLGNCDLCTQRYVCVGVKPCLEYLCQISPSDICQLDAGN